jgi:hypothetical protein
MYQNRFGEGSTLGLPYPSIPEIAPGAFMICPIISVPGMTMEQWLWQQYLYKCAFEQAQAVTRPSLLERDLLGVWN